MNGTVISATAPRPGRTFMEWALLALVFFLIQTALLWRCPPVWRAFDGLMQINFPPNDFTLLQFPAGYPAFSRLHLFAEDYIEGRITRNKNRFDLAQPVRLTDHELTALLISQRLLLAAALAALVVGCVKTMLGRTIAIVLISSQALITLSAQIVGSESLTIILLIALAALGHRIFTSERLSRLAAIAYGLTLFAAIMTRHENATLAGLLPLAYLSASILLTRSAAQNEARRRHWKRAAQFAAIGVVAIGLSTCATRLLCHLFHVVYRPTVARRTSERLGFVDRMSADEKKQFLEELQRKSSDPIIQAAIPLLARKAGWGDQRQEIENLLRQRSPNRTDEELELEADGYLERVSALFIATNNHRLWESALDSVWNGLFQTSPADVSDSYLLVAEQSIDLYAKLPYLHRETSKLTSCRPSVAPEFRRMRQSWWVRLWAAPNALFLLVALLLVATILWRRVGSPSMAVYLLAVTLTGLTITMLTLLFIDLQARFTTALNVCVALTIALLVAHLFETLRSRFGLATVTPPASAS